MPMDDMALFRGLVQIQLWLAERGIATGDMEVVIRLPRRGCSEAERFLRGADLGLRWTMDDEQSGRLVCEVAGTPLRFEEVRHG